MVARDQPNRLSQGGRIRRDRPVSFTFDGRRLTGFEGDTVASALLAQGVHLVGRSFKYHRPRGILTARSEEPNALVTVDRGGARTTPNLRATQQELFDGLAVRSQNRWPSLRWDLGAAAGLAGPLISAGFYYKTFTWPPAWWAKFYEPAIRAAAGLGRAPSGADPDRYLHQYTHCDVLIVGAGPAGLAAALAAVVSGARVVLCDEQAELGGSLLSEPSAQIDGWPAGEWLAEALRTLDGRAVLLPRTTAFGFYTDNFVGLAQRVTDHLASPDPRLPRERLWQVRAGTVVLATGAIERPLVFPGNDRPGIMLAESAREYLHRHAVRVGGRVAVATSSDSAYRAALDLHAAGVGIAAIIDERLAPGPDVLAQARQSGIPVHAATRVVSTEGRRRIRNARLAGTGPAKLACDTLLVSGGWTPSVHLFSQARGRLRFDPDLGAWLPGEIGSRVVCVGACAGTFDLARCLDDGYAAGGSARHNFGVSGLPALAPPGPPRPAAPHAFAFVDFQNDVTTKDLRIAVEEGFESIEHVKRYTTTGMATDQGKTSNLNALATVAALRGREMAEIGLTSFRPPYTPVTFGTLAGASRGTLFDPVRTTPLHAAAEARGAVFEDVGSWKRARYFPRATEDMHAAVARECRAVRRGVGAFDASTLGKIEVVGPDAAAFLDRIYPGNIVGLKPGRCRYAVLLGEDGFIRDDGVIARLAPDRFHVTTTTGGAAFVLHHMEDYLQTEFTDLRAWLTSTTEQWAVIAVQGPRAPEVMAVLTDDADPGVLPHMAVIECHVAGISARLFRVSFTGEIGYEINVPAADAATVWDAVMEAGAPHGIVPYGTETMHVLRAEVGYVIVGQETDGTVVPDDVGLGWTISASKRDFIGKRSLIRADMRRAGRAQLIGLLPRDPAVVPEEGTQVLAEANSSPSLGHVTSAYRSEALGRGFALALVANGRSRIGQKVTLAMNGTVMEAEVTEPRFLPGGLASARKGTVDSALAVPPPPPGQRSRTEPAPLRISRPCEAARMTALAATTRLSVRATPAAATAIGLSLGVLLGSAPNRANVGRDRAALWLGPDEWLVLAPAGETGLARKTTEAAGEAAASIVDISHRNASIELAGERAGWCLNTFCALDLSLAAFPIGMCTRTLLGKAEIVLWRLGAETFHVETTRSMLDYIWECLEEARREFLDPLHSGGESL